MEALEYLLSCIETAGTEQQAVFSSDRWVSRRHSQKREFGFAVLFPPFISQPHNLLLSLTVLQQHQEAPANTGHQWETPCTRGDFCITEFSHRNPRQTNKSSGCSCDTLWACYCHSPLFHKLKKNPSHWARLWEKEVTALSVKLNLFIKPVTMAGHMGWHPAFLCITLLVRKRPNA